ncbi:sugar ABC transporter substrate-binding protein [Paenibacillus nasutitermitis]|uniref:Sugar ABC transporter substrate-binding protein n=1 Tax=Paenibacillus nasutitermitis TaxID=1652958 RepID=A0A917DMA9_9BACL|nr:sugar ABC transporter substrate-binding protein [Paenibacillus nasutitermitis]
MKLNAKAIIVPAVLLTVSLSACSSGNNNPNSTGNENAANGSQETVTLNFLDWDTTGEMTKTTIEKFEEKYPNIKIKHSGVANEGFKTKINALMATGDVPDIAQMTEDLAFKWGSEGKLLDLSKYYDKIPELGNKLESSYYYIGENGENIGYMNGVESFQLFYNREVFEKAGIDAPPIEAEKAWDWDTFLKTAQKLTLDKNGKNASEAGFDPKNIVQYGVNFSAWWGAWNPLLASNNADITNEDGTEFTMNNPESVEVFQALQDLIHKYHVAPSLMVQKNMSSLVTQFKDKRIAMAFDGQWNISAFAENDFNYGVAPLPKFKEPKTILLGSVFSVFAESKHPYEALLFYEFLNDFENNPNYISGNLMPADKKFYTDQASMDRWINNDAHVKEYKVAVIDYVMNHSVIPAAYKLKNWTEIDQKISPKIELIMSGKIPAQQALDELKNEVQPLLQGKYSK